MIAVAVCLAALAGLLLPRPQADEGRHSAVGARLGDRSEGSARRGHPVSAGRGVVGETGDLGVAGKAGDAGEAGETGVVGDAADALELCALALRSGLGMVEALEAVAEAMHGRVAADLRVVAAAHRWGEPAGRAWRHVGASWRPAAVAWQAAEEAGAAPAALVADAAHRIRREEAARVERAVQRAGTLLVLPLGLCFLPGFVLTTVAPVVLHLAGGLLGG